MNNTRLLTSIAVVSVVLNLLLVGFVVGQRLPHFSGTQREVVHIMHDGPGLEDLPPPDAVPGPVPGEARDEPRGNTRAVRMMMGPTDLNLFAAARVLDPEGRRAVEEVFRQRMPEVRANVTNMIEKRRALIEVLEAAPEDMGRLSRALAEVRAAGDAAQQNSHQLFLEIAGGLSPEQRAAFLHAAARRPGRLPR